MASASSESPEAYGKISEKLIQEIGEPILMDKKAIVAAEPDALEKLKRLQEGVR